MASEQCPNMNNGGRKKIIALILIATFALGVYFFYGLFMDRGTPSDGGRLFRSHRPNIPSKSFADVKSQWKNLRHLIIVPGHGIQWCTEIGKSPSDPSCWYLFDFQRKMVPLFLEHIKVGSKLAREDPTSLLVFSGGQTRPGLGPRSEAQSYFSIAEEMGLLDSTLFDRTVTEGFARDSLENLIFSLARFREITGTLPTTVTVVGFPFKAKRFIELHAKAAKLPENSLQYIPVYLDGISQDNIIDDDYADFSVDLYGCGRKLAEKRSSRNPYNLHPGYKDSCPELRQVLSVCDHFHVK